MPMISYRELTSNLKLNAPNSAASPPLPKRITHKLSRKHLCIRALVTAHPSCPQTHACITITICILSQKLDKIAQCTSFPAAGKRTVGNMSRLTHRSISFLRILTGSTHMDSAPTKNRRFYNGGNQWVSLPTTKTTASCAPATKLNLKSKLNLWFLFYQQTLMNVSSNIFSNV
jgi:hypothetical protein